MFSALLTRRRTSASRLSLCLAPLLALGTAGATLGTATDAAANSVNEIVQDMNWNGEGIPDGLNRDWTYKGRVKIWLPPKGVDQITVWGVVYEVKGGNFEWDARVAIRDLKLYQRWGNNWYLSQQDGWINGGAYDANFSGVGYDDNYNPGDRIIHRNRNYTSFRAGRQATGGGAGTNFHFYPYTRAGTNESQRGVFATCQMRLIKHAASRDWNPGNARYVVALGADYYDNGNWLGDVAIGRFKWATGKWRDVNMHNMSEKDLRAVPPPF